MDPRFIVGIDLGTTHTVVAFVRADDPTAKPAIFEVDQLVAPGEIGAEPLLHSLRYHPADAELSPAQRALPWELPEIPKGSAPYVVGELAKELGAKVPGRLVISAKSWLSHPSVDRTAAILPWGEGEGVPKISPVDASASYLAHVRAAWDRKHPDAPLDEQEVVLTIPASFDEGARALTLEAARIAELPRVRLLEEPQAAFYDWLGRQEDVTESAAGMRLAIVVDVGGGTTDLTLVRIENRESGPRLTRIAVGDHLMLGGDNMDLALARDAEAALSGKLPAGRFSQLLAQCRTAKETLLGEQAPESARVTVLGQGSKLIGSALSTEITRAHALSRIVDGFFPDVPRDAAPSRRASAIVEFGLPYVADPAVTRHVAAFIARHQDVAKDAVGDQLVDGLALPDAVLLNGGVFRGAALTKRMLDVLGKWRGADVRVLANTEPELAVARGAARYGLARRGLGMKIGGGSPRSYFLLLDAAAGEARRGLCLLPRGAEEGEEVVVRDRVFALRLGQPVRFPLASSTGEAAYVRAGEIVDVDDDLFRELPPIAAVLDDVAEHAPRSSLARVSVVPRASTPVREEKVQLAAALTEIGTLEMSCIREQDGTASAGRRWKLEFQLRGKSAASDVAPSRVTQLHPRFAEARQRIEVVFGKSEAEGKSVKTLRADLEKILGPREKWPTPLLRELFGVLLAGVKRRRRSADHERVWFNLAGYSLRPGFGYPLDEFRVTELAEIFDQGVQFAPEAQNWSEWWTLWRRVAGGLDEPTQRKVLASLDWYLHPPTPRPRPRPPGPKAQGYDDMVRLAASLERVPSEDKARIGGWLLERLTKHGEGTYSWWALGRIGARVPLYGSAHAVAPRASAEAWLKAVLALDWRAVEPAAFAATMLARQCGDRTRDVDDALRASVIERLARHGAPEAWATMVREVTTLGEDSVARLLGESLPPGLSLLP
jgi:molecular chaperone DnaK (HSP70)